MPRKIIKTSVCITHSELMSALRNACLLNYKDFMFTGCSGSMNSPDRVYYFETTEHVD